MFLLLLLSPLLYSFFIIFVIKFNIAYSIAQYYYKVKCFFTILVKLLCLHVVISRGLPYVLAISSLDPPKYATACPVSISISRLFYRWVDLPKFVETSPPFYLLRSCGFLSWEHPVRSSGSNSSWGWALLASPNAFSTLSRVLS